MDGLVGGSATRRQTTRAQIRGGSIIGQANTEAVKEDIEDKSRTEAMEIALPIQYKWWDQRGDTVLAHSMRSLPTMNGQRKGLK
jgi:hypothetical protein